MLWQDEGVVLMARRHGETSALISVMTRDHGRCRGLVRGGAGRRTRPLCQPGNRLQVTWRARLADQLGTFTLEPLTLLAGRLMLEPLSLAGLNAACTLIEATLPERDPHSNLFDALVQLLEKMTDDESWLEHYVRFELALLAELGFGLDLGACAVSGATGGLAFVSPASGRAVTREAAGAYAARLLPLPPFLAGGCAPGEAEILAGLRLTGAFLRRHLFDSPDRPMPPAREQLIAHLNRRLQS